MYLSNVQIHGFRGIRSLDLRLGATTVLIGENDWGKASFFAALNRCLGPHTKGLPRFTRDDAHQAHDGKSVPLSFALTFRETTEHELKQEQFAAIQPLAQPSGGRQSVTLIIEADLEKETCRVTAEGHEHEPADAALALMQRFCPVLLVQPDRGVACTPLPDTPEASDHRQQIEAQIEKTYDRIVSARQPIAPKEIEQAVADVGELFHEHALRVMPEPPQAGELLESLGNIPQRLALGGGPTMDISKHGSATQAISLLVLAGALLHARGPRALDPSAMPLVLIEEPEAHLHPTLLAGVWGLIDSMNTQRVITTYSGDLLADVELHKLRRLYRTPHGVQVHRVQRNGLNADDRRRLGYHIRALRGGVLFARTWILIEGETEYWLVPELARVLGHDLSAHGVRLIEFAQCGIEPIAKLANELGIAWHLLTDGDSAGNRYVSTARELLPTDVADERITQFQEQDIEHHLFTHGFANVYRTASGRGPSKRKSEQPSSVIHAAIDAYSKPDLALRVIEAAEKMPPNKISETFRNLIDSAIASAQKH